MQRALCVVVNLRTDFYDVYIGRGRGSIYGNPFARFGTTSLAAILVKTREDAVAEYRNWLDGDERWRGVEPERRQKILASLPLLVGQRLGCFCHPLACHGDVLADLVNSLAAAA
jgi:uncharacterized protein DUF4326